MRGLPAALPLTVNERIRSVIEKVVQKVSIPYRYKRRLEFIIDGINGKSIEHTKAKYNSNRQTINKWRKRWKESINDLIELSDQNVTGMALKDHELMTMIIKVLSDKPRSGTPKRITLEQESQIRALACTRPTEHGVEMTTWTHEMLSHVIKAKGIVDKISSRYVGVILKKTK
jgi:transposase